MPDENINTFQTQEEPTGGFNEQEFTDFLCRNLALSFSNHKAYFKKVRKWEKDWEDIKDPKNWPWKGSANWSIPISSTASDGVTARISEAALGGTDPIDVRPLNKTSVDLKDIIKAFMNWDLQTHQELTKELWFFIQNTVWSGTGYIKSYFYKEKTTEERELDAYIVNDEIAKDPNTDVPLEVNERNTMLLGQNGVPFEIKGVTEKTPRWKKYSPEGETVDLRDVYTPISSTGIQDAWDNDWVAVRIWRTKDFLRRQLKQDDKKLYEKLNKIKIKELSGSSQSATDKDERQIQKYYDKTKKLECFEIYVNYDIDDDGIEEKVVALLHYPTKTLFGWEKYPYDHERCPIIEGFIHPIHNRKYGKGIPEKLYDLKGAIDSKHNQRSDRDSLYNNPLLVYTERSGYNSHIHKFGIGRKWKLQNITEADFRFIHPPRADRISYDEEELLLSYVAKRAGMYAMGKQDIRGEKETARGISAVQEAGDVVIRQYVRWISLGLSEFFQQRFDLYQQYWGKMADKEITQWIKEILDIPDNPLSGQGLQAIKQKFNIFLKASQEDKKEMLQKMNFVYSTVTNNPVFQQFPNKLREITIELWRKADVQNPEQYYPTEEELFQSQVEVQKEALRQMEAEKSQINIQEAERKGFEKETLRQEIQNER